MTGRLLTATANSGSTKSSFFDSRQPLKPTFSMRYSKKAVPTRRTAAVPASRAAVSSAVNSRPIGSVGKNTIPRVNSSVRTVPYTGALRSRKVSRIHTVYGKRRIKSNEKISAAGFCRLRPRETAAGGNKTNSGKSIAFSGTV